MTYEHNEPALFRSIGSLATLTAIGAGFAFLRESVLAASFGASARVDAYLVALAMPFMFSTVIVSTFEAAFVPAYMMAKLRGKENVKRMASTAHLLLLVLGFVLSGGLYALSGIVINLQAPGFSHQTLEQTRNLTALIIPSILFSSLYAYGRSLLNAEKRFLFPALAPVIGASVMIVTILLFRNTLGITSAALGYTLGSMALWLTVYVAILYWRLSGYGLSWSWRNPELLQLLRAIVPLLGGGMAMAFVPVIDKAIASVFPAGIISALSYGEKIILLPTNIVATAVATVLFPKLSQHVAEKAHDSIGQTFTFGVMWVSGLLFPTAAFLMVLRQDVVAVLFQRGQFTAEDAAPTAVILLGLSIGLAFVGVFQLIPRTFTALNLPQIVFLSGVLYIIFKVLFNLILIHFFGYLGLALATSSAYFVTGATMYALLRQRIRIFKEWDLFIFLLKAFSCAILMILVMNSLKPWIALYSPLWRACVVGGIGGIFYVTALWIISRKQVAWLFSGVLNN